MKRARVNLQPLAAGNGASDAPAHSTFDVVVIGAGISGLTAAALLAKSGMSVCVVEKCSQPGGSVAGFDRSGFHFETAVHWLNQCGPTGFVRQIFDLIAPGSPIAPECSRIRRYKGGSLDYLLTNNPDEMRDILVANYAHEEKKIRAFFTAGKAMGDAFRNMSSQCLSRESMSVPEKVRRFFAMNRAALPLMRYSLFSAGRGITRFFESDGIRSIFGSEKRLLDCLVPIGWAYDNDFQVPPSGGSRAYPAWLCGVLREYGVSVMLNAPVTGIPVENGRATGVRFASEGHEQEVRARFVIAACDVDSLYRRMLPLGTINGSMLKKQDAAETFNSCMTISLGLDCPAELLGLNQEQVLLKPAGDCNRVSPGEDPRDGDISIIASSFRDPTLAPAGKGNLSVYAPCSLNFGNCWESERGNGGEFIRGQAYKSFKQRMADILIERVEKDLIPGLRSHIEILDVATPLTYLRYTGNRNGAIMGFRPSFNNVRRRVARYDTPLPNLFIGSQWAELGGGIPLAVKTGVNSALLILKKEAPDVYRNVCEMFDTGHKAVKKQLRKPQLTASADQTE